VLLGGVGRWGQAREAPARVRDRLARAGVGHGANGDFANGSCAGRGDAQPSRRQAAGCSKTAAHQEDDMRVAMALNRLLRLLGASVIDVSFSAPGVIVTVWLRRGRRVCSRWGARRPAGSCRSTGAESSAGATSISARAAASSSASCAGCAARSAVSGWPGFCGRGQARRTPATLRMWSWASRSRLVPFIKLARTIRRHRTHISPIHQPGAEHADPARILPLEFPRFGGQGLIRRAVSLVSGT
jgi:hypothetical protein